MTTKKQSVLTDEDRAYLASLDDGASIYSWRIVQYIEKRIAEEVAAGRFSEAEARADLEVALELSHALLNQDRYESYAKAVLALRAAERSARGCGRWFYRMACGLLYCGRIEEAKAHAERAVIEEPGYPWGWLELGKLRAHFGDRDGALAAVSEGLKLVPGDAEFLTLRREIQEGADLLAMEFHHIDPDADASLQSGDEAMSGILEKKRSIFCILKDETALGAILDFFDFSDYRPAEPPERLETEGVSEAAGVKLRYRFLMNEAGLSHMTLGWLRRVVKRLPEILESKKLAPEEVEFVLIRQDRIVELQPKAGAGEEDRLLLDFRSTFVDASQGEAPRHDAEPCFSEGSPADEAAVLRRIAALNDEDRYREIIDAIEALPEEARTPKVLGELARACNNLAQPGEDRLFLRAVDILERTAEACRETHEWNFRMGYALFYLDREGEALAYFERALELRPGDEDTMAMIDACRRGVTLPVFRKPFAGRAEEAWSAFAAEEGALLGDIARKRFDEALERAAAALGAVSGDWSLQVGLSAEDPRPELVLSPDGRRTQVPSLLAFAAKMPDVLRAHWRLQLGRPGSRALYAGDTTGAALLPGFETVSVCIEREESGGVSLRFWDEAFAAIEDEKAAQAWFRRLQLVLDHLLGEAAVMRWVRGIGILRRPPDEPGLPLLELPRRFAECFPGAADLTLADIAEERVEYWLKPIEDPEADLYWDVGEGWTSLPALMNGYRDLENGEVERYARQGAAAGFFFFEGFDGVDARERSERAKAFLEDFRCALAAEAGGSHFFCGLGVGLHRFYADVCIWNLHPLMEAAQAFLERHPEIRRAGWHTFRRAAGSVMLREPEETPAA